MQNTMVQPNEPVEVDPLNNAVLNVQALRDNIFLGQGYHIIRGFLQPHEVEHILNAWDGGHNTLMPRFSKHQHIFEGCPDYSVVSPELARHYNFFWNRPLDNFTYNTAWRMQTMRNSLEGVAAGREFLPHGKGIDNEHRAASYRVIFTKNGGPVGAHVDYAFDHSRIQMSLNLTVYGQDYQSGGFLFYDKFRDGEPFNLGERENLQPGDLVVFRYGQKHAVEPVASAPGQRGFCRILMPQEIVPLGSARDRARRRFARRIDKLKNKSKGTPKSKAETEALYYDFKTQEQMKVAIASGFSPAEVYHPAGLWVRAAERAETQVALLKQHGLQPHHQVLDLGCGFAALGLKLIHDLNSDRYCGLDRREEFIELGRTYLEAAISPGLGYDLVASADLDFEVFDRKFDFVLAQPAFTELPAEQTAALIEKLTALMNAGGQAFFALSGHDADAPQIPSATVQGAEPKTLAFYESLARKLAFKVELLTAEPGAQVSYVRAIF